MYTQIYFCILIYIFVRVMAPNLVVIGVKILVSLQLNGKKNPTG